MLSMHELSLIMPEPILRLSILILATYPVADIRPRSKPKSKLTSPNFNMLTFCGFGWFWLILAKCSWLRQAAVSPTEQGGGYPLRRRRLLRGGLPPLTAAAVRSNEQGGLTPGGGG